MDAVYRRWRRGLGIHAARRADTYRLYLFTIPSKLPALRAQPFSGVPMSQSAAVSTIALKTFPLFQGLPEDELASIARVAMMRRIPRNHRS